MIATSIPVVMYGIAGYALSFFVIANRYVRAMNAPAVTKSAGISPNVRRKTPAVMIGKIMSPPPRIARLTLNFLFFIFFGIFLPLYFCFMFLISSLTFFEAEGIMSPPKILSSFIWNFAIFCMMPDFQTAHAS